MTCKQSQENLEAYLDGELTLSDRRDYEEHLVDCKDCQAMLESLQSLSQSIQKIGYASKPASLRKNIRNGLLDIIGEESSNFNWPQLLGFAGGSAAIGALSVWVIMIFVVGLPMQAQLADELVSAHVRSMMVDHATDIASTDQHTVKPWFNGRLDFSPKVKDLKAEGYPLTGGRLDYLQQQPVAALVYKRRAHVINLFIQRSEKTAQELPTSLEQQQGYNLVSWQQQGLHYTLVSDLNVKELNEMAVLLDGQAEKSHR